MLVRSNLLRIASLIRSYGLTKYLTPVIKQYAWVDKILVMNYQFKGVPAIEDATLTCISEVNQPNVEVNKGLGNLTQHEVFNRGIELLKDYDLIFISDADEFLARADQNDIVLGMVGHDIGVCRVIDYAKDFNHRYPIRTHRPAVICRPSARFYDVRCYIGGAKYFDTIFLHHLGYIYSPEELGWKLNWEKIYEGDSVNELVNKQPEPYEMPQEIRDLLNDNGCSNQL